MQKQSIRGNYFEIDEAGFVTGPAGHLGHVGDCELLAELLQSLLEITDQITL